MAAKEREEGSAPRDTIDKDQRAKRKSRLNKKMLLRGIEWVILA